MKKTLSLLFAMLLILAACQRQDKPKSANKYKAPKNVATDTEGLFKMRYRLKWLDQAQFAGAYVALEKGFYLQRGLDVEILEGGPDYPQYGSLLDSSADVVGLHLLIGMNYFNSPRPVVNIGQVLQKSSTLLVGKKSTGIANLKDLAGKKVGVWRGQSYVRYFLDEQHLGIRSIPIDWSVNLLLNDAIDMMNATSYNEYHRIMMSGLDEDELVVFPLAEHGFNVVEDGLYVLKDYYKKHPQECKDFSEATMEGWLYAFEHPEEALQIVISRMRENHRPTNPGHQLWMLQHMEELILGNGEPGKLKKSDLDFANRILMESGELKKPIPYEEFCPL